MAEQTWIQIFFNPDDAEIIPEHLKQELMSEGVYQHDYAYYRDMEDLLELFEQHERPVVVQWGGTYDSDPSLVIYEITPEPKVHVIQLSSDGNPVWDQVHDGTHEEWLRERGNASKRASEAIPSYPDFFSDIAIPTWFSEIERLEIGDVVFRVFEGSGMDLEKGPSDERAKELLARLRQIRDEINSVTEAIEQINQAEQA